MGGCDRVGDEVGGAGDGVGDGVGGAVGGTVELGAVVTGDLEFLFSHSSNSLLFSLPHWSLASFSSDTRQCTMADCSSSWGSMEVR